MTFEQAYRHYYAYIAAIGWRATRDRDQAADLAQATFLEAWRCWDRAPVEDPPGLRAWLACVARRQIGHARQYAQARKRGRTVPYDWTADRRRHSETPERIVLQRERIERLAWGLTTCLPRERRILAGRLAGLEYRDIAARLGCTEVAAKHSMQLARGRLRRILDAG